MQRTDKVPLVLYISSLVSSVISNLSTAMCLALSRWTDTHQMYHHYWVTFIDDLLLLLKGSLPAEAKVWDLCCIQQFKDWAENVMGHSEGWHGWRVHVQRVWGILHWAWHPEAAHCQESPSAEWCCREEQQDNGRWHCLHALWVWDDHSLLGEALATFIHASNRLLTSALPDSTPHKAFFGSKPDLSMLRVWGCTAYVLIQRDKQALGSLGTMGEVCLHGIPSELQGLEVLQPCH